MTEGRLPTHLWVAAGVARCSQQGVPATVVRRGERQSGAVLLKLAMQDRLFRVLAQARDIRGKLGWMGALDGATVPEAEADAYIERAVRRDPDLWVVEIEHREGWHPFVDGTY
ncbi:MAG: DUF1491 family protein [Alphaproteobacteria bacterium]